MGDSLRRFQYETGEKNGTETRGYGCKKEEKREKTGERKEAVETILVIDGNAVYELDQECLRHKK